MHDVTSQVPLAPPSASSALALARPTGLRLEARPRVWPGVVIVALQWLVIKAPVWLTPEAPMIQFQAMFFGPLVAAVAIVAWWLFFSRVPWADRLLGVGAATAAGVAALFLCDPTFKFGLLLYALPVATTAWALWLLVTPFLPWPVRRVGLVMVFLLVWGGFSLVRQDGVTGSLRAEWNWRWAPTAEDKYRAEREAREAGPVVLSAGEVKPVALQASDWPGFRGPKRDGRLLGVRIATDWNERPPPLLWQQRIGPGWGSFAVIGNRLYTQEQLGEKELVVCYRASTGKEMWAHEDEARFTEIVAGAGPRATPTFHEGKLYTLGAKGQLNCLDADTGKVLWARDIVADSGAKVPVWGFASSPLVAQGVVTVFAGGPDGKSVLGYHATSGSPAWSAGEGEFSYCSPQLTRVQGEEQVLIATDRGLTAFHPTRGTVLWDHSYPMGKGQARVIQPALVGSSDFLLGASFGFGTRRIHVAREGKSWTEQEVWTTQRIKPYYNDLVVHKGHLYGIDGELLTCVSLEDGANRWRARGHANGQVLLLADQDVLLVLSEKGDVALVEASPEKHKVLGRFQALQGKTWNHPVVAHGKLFVRNGEKIACYQLDEIGSGKVGGK